MHLEQLFGGALRLAVMCLVSGAQASCQPKAPPPVVRDTTLTPAPPAPVDTIQRDTVRHGKPRRRP